MVTGELIRHPKRHTLLMRQTFARSGPAAHSLLCHPFHTSNMQSSYLRSFLHAATLVAVFTFPIQPAIHAIADGVPAKTLLDDNFDSGPLTWNTYPDLSVPPSATFVPDPAESDTAKDASPNYSLRFIRKSDARVFRDIPAVPATGTIAIEFRVLKTSSANSAGLWLVNSTGEGIGFLCELNTPQTTNRLKVLRTSDSADTCSLIKALTNVAQANPPGEKKWHRVTITWNTATGEIDTTIDGQTAGKTTAAVPSSQPLTRAILQGSFPNSVYMDDIRITIAAR